MTDNAITRQAIAAARERLNFNGDTIQAWSKRHGIHPSTVYEVLGGRNKCTRGDAHKAAVLLGIKPGVILTLDKSLKTTTFE